MDVQAQLENARERDDGNAPDQHAQEHLPLLVARALKPGRVVAKPQVDEQGHDDDALERVIARDAVDEVIEQGRLADETRQEPQYRKVKPVKIHGETWSCCRRLNTPAVPARTPEGT